MNIHYFDNPTPEFTTWMTNIGIKSTLDSSDAEIFYVHFSSMEGVSTKKLEHILCPCTNIDHLGDIPKYFNTIYLEDKQFLYKYVRSTAETTLWGMLTLLKKHEDELNTKTVGLIGFGRVGQQVAQMLQGFNVNVIFCEPDKYWEPYECIRNVTRVEYKDILKNADIISLHCTSDSSTMNLISKEDFAAMEKKPYFINTSRGRCVNGKDLVAAVMQQSIKAFYIDVWDTYDEITKMALEKMACLDDNLLTKHIAGKGKKSRLETDRYVCLKLMERLRS